MIIPVLKGTGVGLIVAVPLWWLPSFLQLALADMWLIVMILPPIMLGGYIAARSASRPILTGVLTGLVTMLLIISVALTTEELGMIPILMLVGGVFAGLGAYIAVLAGHTATQK